LRYREFYFFTTELRRKQRRDTEGVVLGGKIFVTKEMELVRAAHAA
jgi:hypothetical protein